MDRNAGSGAQKPTPNKVFHQVGNAKERPATRSGEAARGPFGATNKKSGG
jgi:hypothetical protein